MKQFLVKSNNYVMSAHQSDLLNYSIFSLISYYDTDLIRCKRSTLHMKQITWQHHRQLRVELTAEKFWEWKNLRYKDNVNCRHKVW